MTVPSSSDRLAMNTPRDGGFDFVIVRSEPPPFDTTRDRDCTAPATVSNASAAGSMTSDGGAPAAPDIPIIAAPPLLSTPNVAPNEPAVAGEKLTATVTVAPGASVEPGAGRSPTANGAGGGVKAFQVSGEEPVLVSVMLPD